MYYPMEGSGYGCGRGKAKRKVLEPHVKELQQHIKELEHQIKGLERELGNSEMGHALSKKAHNGLTLYREKYANMREAHPDLTRAQINEKLKEKKVKYVPVGKTKLDINLKKYRDKIKELQVFAPEFSKQQLRDASYATLKGYDVGSYPNVPIPLEYLRPISDLARLRGQGTRRRVHHKVPVGHYW